MPRLLALEWDAKEARAVVARTRAGGVAIEHALAIALPQREGAAATEAEVGAAIGRALSALGVSRAETLVAVGRSSIELKFLSTPPAPPEELPDLVRFQALRQFTSLADDWPLDFVPLSPSADGGSNVLAAAISPEFVQQIRQTASAANLTVSRLVLRPFAAASLIKSAAADGKCRMAVDLLADDADLTVMIGEQVIFPRTVRLPAAAEPEVLARALLGEGRRTMVAAQNQLGGRLVEEVVIFGDSQHHATLKQLLESELSRPIKIVDPFDLVEWDTSARGKKPEFPGRFAPLLGMLLDESSGTAHAIDFLHPRKKAAPPNQRRTLAIAAAAVAAFILLGLGAIWWQLSSLDAQIRSLQAQRNDQEKLVKKGDKPRRDAATLDRFAAADVTWLDELRHLSDRFPASGSAQVEELSANFDPKGGGKLTVAGKADQESRIADIGARVRDEYHKVNTSGTTFDDKAIGKLPWRFSEIVTVALPNPDAPRSATDGSSGPAKPAPKASAAKGGK